MNFVVRGPPGLRGILYVNIIKSTGDDTISHANGANR